MTTEKVLHYELLEHLGGGGMGDVYKARDTKLNRLVALKFLPESWNHDQIAKARFMREARTASAVDHPNICTIYDVGESDDGRLFIAMAYYQGETLQARIDRGSLPSTAALDYAKQVAVGLQKVHDLGIVHRDIKPANLFITNDSTVKILDFGLAKLSGDARITAEKAPMGTVAYMSPEQTKGDDVDPRTDIWSLGVVLYEMLTGKLPFEGGNSVAMIFCIRFDDPTPVADVAPQIPAELSTVVERCLRKPVSERYKTALNLAAALDGSNVRGSSDQAQLPGKLSRPSIAVLPFVNVGAHDDEYFSDGLTDELITALAQITGLQVVSRTTMFGFKGTSENVQTIGQKLKVASVLEGTVRKSDNKLRITAQLIDVSTGYQIWSEQYAREAEDVFVIQDEIAKRIASKLKVRLSSDRANKVPRHKFPVLEAYHLYLMGRYHWHQQTPDGFDKALHNFERALAKDPDYARAHSGLADYYAALGAWSLAPSNIVWPQAKRAAVRAVELDPDLAEAHVSLADVYMYYEWGWNSARAELLMARSLNPTYGNAHVEYAVYLIVMGNLREALVVAEQARELDPLSPAINTSVVAALYYSRRYERAIKECLRSLELHPAYPELNVLLGLAQVECGRFDEALAAFERGQDTSGVSPLMIGCLGWCRARAGHREEALQSLLELERLGSESFVAPFCHAMIFVGLDDRDEAFAWLQKSAEQKDALMCYLNVWPIFDSLREETRFRTLLKQMRLEPREQTTAIRDIEDSDVHT